MKYDGLFVLASAILRLLAYIVDRRREAQTGSHTECRCVSMKKDDLLCAVSWG